MVTKNTPSTDTNKAVTPFPGAVEGHLNGVQRHLDGVCGGNSGTDDLLGLIKAVLEMKGIELYRMNTEQEGYQVRHKDQVLHIYAKRVSHE